MKFNNRGNWSLIGLLVTAAIIVIAAGVYFGGGAGLTSVKKDSKYLDKTSKKQTVVGQSLDTAKGEVCRQQLDQIRKGIEAYKAANATEDNPQTFKDIGLGVSNEYFQCPVSKQPYTYDPATGQANCPNHTNF